MDHANARDAHGAPNSALDEPPSPGQPERYCRRCQALLPVLDRADPKCLACGLQFNPHDPATYRQRRALSTWIFWLPGFSLAVASGIITYAICLRSNNLGLAMFVAVPMSAGAILGYATRGKTALVLVLAALAIPSIVLGLITLSAVGFFCGFTLSLIFVVPLLVGVLLGLGLRWILCAIHWDHRWYFPVLVFILAPYAAQGVENLLPRSGDLVVVRTERALTASPQQAWNAILFYEDVDHAPPWLLRLALPKPLRSIGEKRRVGETIRCLYDRGYLSKRITEIEEGRRLSFEVVEQHLHFERDITLRDGSFEVVPAERGEALVVLTTRYQPRLSPRWLWEPMERRIVSDLHGHVLEGMARHTRRLEQEIQPPSNEPPRYEAPDYKHQIAATNSQASTKQQ